ncbi:unnamed protein product [Rotaria sp. Silwood1]|nr:unnamed protein product [Rotaria sp. Silwood1]
MSQKYKQLREQILTLHDLHKKWSPSNIADELQNSDCPPPQTRHALVRYINYTINRGTVNPRRRSGRPRTTRTAQFISLVKKPEKSYSKWKKLINTDFSGRINLVQKHNSKNNVVWSISKATISLDLQTIGQQKYSSGIILFGAISSRGLIPRRSPIFIDEWLKSECKKLNKERISMDRFLYIKLVKSQLKPHIDRSYNGVQVIWQDDADPKHRSQYALNQIHEMFYERIEPEQHANKMADIWPIENIWGYIKEKLEENEFENVTMLKKKIVTIWNTITPRMCSNWINSIPRRLQCLIKKKKVIQLIKKTIRTYEYINFVLFPIVLMIKIIYSRRFL